MGSGTNVGSATSRRSSAGHAAQAKPDQAGAVGKEAEAAERANSPEAGAATSPLTIRLTDLPGRAPLQRLTPHHKSDVAQYLTFTEVVSLLLAAKDMRKALLEDPRLKFDGLGRALSDLGCNELVASIRSIETDVLMAKWQPAAKPSLWPPTEKRKQAAAREREREQEAQKAEFVTQLQKLEPKVEKAVFHVAASRRPRQPVETGGAAEPTPWQLAMERLGPLYNAVENGDVEMVRTGLREFLSLPTHLISADRKVAWVGAPHRKSMLYTSGQRCCGTLPPVERLHYEAITAYVGEIVGSPYLDLSHKTRLCVHLKVENPRKQDDQRGLIDIVAFAMHSKNPAVAAAVLLGINESAATRDVKDALLISASASWTSGLGDCVNAVSRYLKLYRHRAPQWVDDVIGRLQRVLPTEPV